MGNSHINQGDSYSSFGLGIVTMYVKVKWGNSMKTSFVVA